MKPFKALAGIVAATTLAFFTYVSTVYFAASRRPPWELVVAMLIVIAVCGVVIWRC